MNDACHKQLPMNTFTKYGMFSRSKKNMFENWFCVVCCWCMFVGPKREKNIFARKKKRVWCLEMMMLLLKREREREREDENKKKKLRESSDTSIKYKTLQEIIWIIWTKRKEKRRERFDWYFEIRRLKKRLISWNPRGGRTTKSNGWIQILIESWARLFVIPKNRPSPIPKVKVEKEGKTAKFA